MKWFVSCLLAVLACVSTVEARVKKTLPEVTRVIPSAEVTAEIAQDLISGLYPNTAIEFSQGSSLPLCFLFDYNVFSVQYDPALSVTVKTPCYLRVVKKKSYMSFDLSRWEKSSRVLFDGKPEARLKRVSNPDRVIVETQIVKPQEP